MPQKQKLPRLLLTSGEPAGIGPELLVRIAQQPFPAQLVALGNAALLQATAARLGLPLQLHDFAVQDEAQRHMPGSLYLIELPLAEEVFAGQLNVANARFVLAQLQVAAELALHKEVDAIVTNPLQKSVINEAGTRFSGHTEFFAEAAGDVPVLMLLANEHMRVALLTTHLPLHAVPAALSAQKLRDTLQLLHRELRAVCGLPAPRITVLGLNPHAGEKGHMGSEEIEIMQPVITQLRAEGMKLKGPVSADTAFTPDKLTQTDAYLAMYHDQGLPVLKALGFHRSVNITLGLPFIRTSVDHGTALDLAGKGIADAGSLHYAIETALHMLQWSTDLGT